MKTVRSWLLSFAERFNLPKPKSHRTINTLNRSRKWKRANSYKHARAISPYPDRPVR